MATHETETAELIQSIGLLIRKVRSAAAGHELSLSEGAVLARLEREGTMTTADLARAESVKPQSMGATVTALEERGFVKREPHPTDGRQMLIALTREGLSIRRTTREAKHSWLAKQVDALSEREKQTLFAAGRILRRMVE